MDCSPPGFSVHGILQARVLEWVAISSSRGSSRPRDLTLHSLHWQAGSEPPGKLRPLTCSPSWCLGDQWFGKLGFSPGHRILPPSIPHPVSCMASVYLDDFFGKKQRTVHLSKFPSSVSLTPVDYSRLPTNAGKVISGRTCWEV